VTGTIPVWLAVAFIWSFYAFAIIMFWFLIYRVVVALGWEPFRRTRLFWQVWLFCSYKCWKKCKAKNRWKLSEARKLLRDNMFSEGPKSSFKKFYGRR